MNIINLYGVNANASTEKKWGCVRIERNRLLDACDWTQLPDAALTPEELESWQNYRQALRDMPQDFDNPDDVVFPEPPGVA